MTKYERAPITEAVIEIRLANPLPKDKVDAIHARLKREYTNSETVSAIEFRLDVKERHATVGQEEASHYKLSSADRADILMITPLSMVCSRMAPYDGWEFFQPRARANWRHWNKVVGYQKIQRLGVRYINRIDIPYGDKERLKIEDYLTVHPEYPYPEVIDAIEKYTMQLTSHFGEENFALTLNSSNVPSPLVDYLSIAFDIDIGMTDDVPQRDDRIWEIFDLIREHKNRIFEECITDKSRELFAK